MTQQSMAPENAVSPKAPTNDQLQRAFGRTIVFVLAPNRYAKENLEAAAQAARHTQAPGIFIMADMSCADEAVSVVRRLQRKGRVMMQAAEFDFSIAYGDNTQGRDFHLEELPLNMLKVMGALSQSVLDIYESILVIDATKPAPLVDDLYALQLRLPSEPPLEGQAALGNQADPTPLAISRQKLDQLQAID